MKRLVFVICFFSFAFIYAQEKLNTPKYCMHCKGIKTTLTLEGTPYACKYCNGTGVLLKTSKQNATNNKDVY